MTQQDLARQQTALAWGRTSLAVCGFGAAMLRLGALHHSIPDLLAALGLLVCGLLLAMHSRALYRGPAGKPAARMLRLVTVAALLTGALVTVADAT